MIDWTKYHRFFESGSAPMCWNAGSSANQVAIVSLAAETVLFVKCAAPNNKSAADFLRSRRLLAHADQNAQHFKRAIQVTGHNQRIDIREFSIDVR